MKRKFEGSIPAAVASSSRAFVALLSLVGLKLPDAEYLLGQNKIKNS